MNLLQESPNTAKEASFWLYDADEKYPTDFELILTYFPKGYIPPLCDKDALEGCMKENFNSDGTSKDGRMHIARQSEPFFH